MLKLRLAPSSNRLLYPGLCIYRVSARMQGLVVKCMISFSSALYCPPPRQLFPLAAFYLCSFFIGHLLFSNTSLSSRWPFSFPHNSPHLLFTLKNLLRLSRNCPETTVLLVTCAPAKCTCEVTKLTLCGANWRHNTELTRSDR